MNYSHNTQNNDILSALFQPKVLFGLFLIWLLVVAAGSGIAMLATQHSLMSDAEVEQLLSENERLALAANVAYASETATEDTIQYDSLPVYPDRIEVPSIGIDLPISNPQTRDVDQLDEALKTAAVRYPDSAALGEQGGNTLVFGHSSRLPVVRNQLYKAFNDIEDLNTGDRIIASAGRDTYTYQVTRVYQASAHDDRIPLDVAGHQITLLTCDSFGSKSDRWVVEAEYLGKNI